jgi:EAL domain-containing protein (putative c-di-GMP-specific phosphodiesterase class I)
VLDRVMAETRHLTDLTVGFNASALEFADPVFVDDLAALMRLRGYDPRQLEIEITETALLAEGPEVAANIARLADLGVRTALDDFGAGGGGLEPLRRLAFDTVKIDKGLVQAAGLDPRAATLIGALTQFCQSRGARVVGEGVEHPAQASLLAGLGVPVLQGYLFGEPVPVGDLPD